MDVKVINSLMSDAQVETFAYNIYRDIAVYMKTNFEDFLWWSLKDISKDIIQTLDGIIHTKDGKYESCKYDGGDYRYECSNLC